MKFSMFFMAEYTEMFVISAVSSVLFLGGYLSMRPEGEAPSLSVYDTGALGATAAYEQAVRIDPNYLEAYYNLGLTYGELGRHEEATEAFREIN